jgi:molecular chaperone GrpE
MYSPSRRLSRLSARPLLLTVGRGATRSSLSSPLLRTWCATTPPQSRFVARSYADETQSNAQQPKTPPEQPKSQEQQAKTSADQSKPQEQQQQQQTQPPQSEPTPEQKKIKELELELSKAKDDLLRSLAERENIVRISQNNVEAAKLYGIKSFAESMLDIADNLERALESVPQDKRNNEDVKALFEGVAMTEKVTLQILAKYGIHKFKPFGEKFDPKKHSALFEIQDPTKPPGSIAFVQAAGYTLHDRLLRPAQVGVVANRPEPETETKTPQSQSATPPQTNNSLPQ